MPRSAATSSLYDYGQRHTIMRHMNRRSWWGGFNLERDEALRWRIGPLTLWLRRRPHEWQLAHRRDDGEIDHPPLEAGVTESEWSRAAEAHNERIDFRETKAAIELVPMLADRPVVTRPKVPIYLSGGEEVTVYVSSPLRVRSLAGGVFMQEVATQRPSDTWVGPNTREGELCYASETHCRLSLDELPWRPHRAVTPLLLRNRDRRPLLIERLNLPVGYLSLYANEQGALWTQTVTIKREQGSDVLDVGTASPAEAGAARLVCRPRSEPDKGGVIRAFTSMFGCCAGEIGDVLVEYGTDDMSVWWSTLTGMMTSDRSFMLLRALVIVTIGFVIARSASHALLRVLGKYLDAQQRMVLQRAAYYLLFGLFVISALRELGFSLSVLLGAAGILSVAIGFASQTSTSNHNNKKKHNNKQPFFVGDVIKINVTTGVVLSIDLLSVKLRTFDGRY